MIGNILWFLKELEPTSIYYTRKMLLFSVLLTFTNDKGQTISVKVWYNVNIGKGR